MKTGHVTKKDAVYVGDFAKICGLIPQHLKPIGKNIDVYASTCITQK